MNPCPPNPIPLMAITDRDALGMGSLVAAAEAALGAGLPALMLREKDLPEEQLLPLATRLREATLAAGAAFIINRRIRLARATRADGLHTGADGPGVAEVRRELGAEIIIGYSAHSRGEALRAFEAGADYVIFSPIYATPSKAGILEPVGLEALAELAAAVPGPVIALGGINESNIAEVAGTGAAGAAVIRAVFAHPDPDEAVRRLLTGWNTGAAQMSPLSHGGHGEKKR